MSEKVETCFICAEPTGRAGAGEDSLYIGNIGPFDEKCWEIIKTHILSQLREGVEGLERYLLENFDKDDRGMMLLRSEVLALIEEVGGE